MTGGLFISFEGIDGAGKSTHIEALAQAFTERGRAVLRTREPGGTALAEALRALVLQEAMDPLTEALLVFAARRDHVSRVIRPALARGDVVLCDRFSDASFAYQGGGRGLDWAVLEQLETWVQAAELTGLTLQPALTIWFDLPASVAAERLAKARAADRFESQPLAFFEAVRSAYATRVAEQPTRFVCIQADQAPDLVWQAVLQAVQAKGLLP